MIKIGSHCIGQDGRVVELVSEKQPLSCVGCVYFGARTRKCGALYPLENRRGEFYTLDCHTNNGIFIEVTHND